MSLLPLVGALLLPLPWIVLARQDFHPSPVLVAVLTGAAILGAAFVLSWAAELVQMDVSQALALALLALIAVLPEYAVDAVFAFRAGQDPVVAQAGYAVANMTGANRLLIGVGWSSVVFVAWWRQRSGRRRRAHIAEQVDPSEGEAQRQVGNTAVKLEPGQIIELTALGAATLYSFVIPFKGGIGPMDTAFLFGLFAVYAWAVSRVPAGHPELVGPAAAIGALSTGPRRAVTYGLFAYAAAAILVSAEPFAEGLVHTGTALGVDEFLLVQWLAPLASETPEFLVALLFAWRGAASAGLRTLIASKVNQWTLLIGTLGAAYSLAVGGLANLPLDERQVEELVLTSAQSLFALALIANFDLSVREALLLLSTFLLQAFFPSVEIRLAMAALYCVAGVVLLTASRDRRATLLHVPRLLREALQPTPATVDADHDSTRRELAAPAAPKVAGDQPAA